MSEFNAIRNAVRAEKTLAKTAKAVETAGPDLSKGFNVRGLKDQLIPFKAGTDVEKAKTWTKNFYNRDVEETLLSKTEEGDEVAYEQLSVKTKRTVKEARDEGAYDTPAGEVMYLRTADEYQIRHSYVPKEARGQGVAAGLYRHIFDQAKKDGRKVISDSRLSSDAVAIWERMKELGYPIISYPQTKRITQASAHGDEVIDFIRAGSKREEDLPLYEYDPLGHGGSDIKRQAGQTAADKKGPKTDMFLEPQANGMTFTKGKKGPAVVGTVMPAAEEATSQKEEEPRLLKPMKVEGTQGLKEPGNIDLDHRKTLKNKDGTTSTELSFSIGTDKGEVLIPQVVDGVKLSKEDAIEHYKKTGEHLGIFETREDADRYAESLHLRQEKKYVPK